MKSAKCGSYRSPCVRVCLGTSSPTLMRPRSQINTSILSNHQVMEHARVLVLHLVPNNDDNAG